MSRILAGSDRSRVRRVTGCLRATLSRTLGGASSHLSGYRHSRSRCSSQRLRRSSCHTCRRNRNRRLRGTCRRTCGCALGGGSGGSTHSCSGSCRCGGRSRSWSLPRSDGISAGFRTGTLGSPCNRCLGDRLRNSGCSGWSRRSRSGTLSGRRGYVASKRRNGRARLTGGSR